MKADYWAIFDGIEAAAGTAARAEPRKRARRFATKWRPLFPSAIECLEDDVERLITYLRFPTEHCKRIRRSNSSSAPSARLGGGVKVIGRLPGEQSCLSLLWAVLDGASRGWRGVEMTPVVVCRLQKLRRELIEPPTDHDDGQEVIDQADAPIVVKRQLGVASGSEEVLEADRKLGVVVGTALWTGDRHDRCRAGGRHRLGQV